MRPAGGFPSLSPANPAFSLIFCPHPPNPLPGGKGEIKSLFRRGLRPRHPCIRPFAAFTNFSKQEPGAKGSPRFAARMARNAFLWTVPAAKERGDRGRWNYPSHATAAFEMVLSPGAGRTNAARGAGKYAKGGGWQAAKRENFPPCSCALQKNFQKPLTEAAQYDIIAKRCQDSGKGHGGVAQLARATGSYPVGHRFKSGLRYHIGQGSAVPYPSGTALVRGFPPGPLVKRPKTPPFHGGNSSSNLLRVTK